MLYGNRCRHQQTRSVQLSKMASNSPLKLLEYGISNTRKSIRFTDGKSAAMTTSRDSFTVCPVLSILIPALNTRPWEKIWSKLTEQAKTVNESYLYNESQTLVEVLVESDNGQITSGQKRQLLADKSKGLYRAFVDDDDDVSEGYVEHLLDGCTSGADVVSFNMKIVNHPMPQVNQHKSRGRNIQTPMQELWRLGIYPPARQYGMMTVNHLCAWKREIADKVAWDPMLGYGDDQIWYKTLYLSGLVKTCWHINRVLYHYLYNPKTSVNQDEQRRLNARVHVAGGFKVYQTGEGELLIQTRRPDNTVITPQASMKPTPVHHREVWVRDRKNTIFSLSPTSPGVNMLGTIILE